LRVHSLELHAALDDTADVTRLDESAG
jgi:hypothetical protein